VIYIQKPKIKETAMRKSFYYILILGKDYKDVMSSEVTENLQSSDSI